MAAAKDKKSPEALTRLGIRVEPIAAGPAAPGERRYAVRGETYPHRQKLQELGGQWDKLAHVWIFPAPDPTEILAAALPAAAPSSDGAALANRPHYWGHRQRLRERALKGGMGTLPDYELLELILFGSIQRADVKPLAKELLAKFGSLAAILNAAPDALASFAEINQQTLANFRAILELAKRLQRADLQDRPVLNSIDKVAAYARAEIGHSEIEKFHILFLDQRHALIADEVQQTGTINEVMIYPREIVHRALNLGAVGLVLVHNHPSGNLKPSPGDIDMTREIKRAAEGVGVDLLDHLIVAKSGYISLRQIGKLPK